MLRLKRNSLQLSKRHGKGLFPIIGADPFFALVSLTATVGGSLRAGDIINIKVVVDMSMDKILNGTSAGTNALPDVVDFSYTSSQIGMEGDGTYELGEDNLIEQPLAQDSDLASILLSGLEEMFSDSDDYVWSASGRYACVPVCENVRVVNAYTSAGVDTAASNANGETQVTNIVTIVVPKALEEKIVLACEEGTLRVSRVIQNTEEGVAEEKPAEDKAAEEKAPVSDETAGDK